MNQRTGFNWIEFRAAARAQTQADPAEIGKRAFIIQFSTRRRDAHSRTEQRARCAAAFQTEGARRAQRLQRADARRVLLRKITSQHRCFRRIVAPMAHHCVKGGTFAGGARQRAAGRAARRRAHKGAHLVHSGRGRARGPRRIAQRIGQPKRLGRLRQGKVNIIPFKKRRLLRRAQQINPLRAQALALGG